MTKIKRLDEIMKFNEEFVKNKEYVKYQTTKKPKKKVVILSCMDTRLTDLLPKALNIKNGDAKIIKNAGATITHPFGSIMRSIIVAIYEFKVDEVLIIGHHGCGMCNLDTEDLLGKILNRGIKEDDIEMLKNSGINVEKFLHGFESVNESVKDSVDVVKNHPLIPKDTIIHGLVICPETGKLDIIINGYDK